MPVRNYSTVDGQVMGQWTTVDPLWPEEPAYGYVGGRPVDWVDPSGMNNLPQWVKDYYRGRRIDPPSPGECEKLQSALKELTKRLEKMRRRGWDKPENDPGGKEWRQGNQRGITRPGGHFDGKYVPAQEAYDLLKRYIDGHCGPPPPPLEPCRAPLPEPAVEPPYGELAAEVGLTILLLILLRGGGRGVGVPFNPIGRPVILA